MENTATVTETNVALKEWAVVVKALKSGQQIIMLRKGGISEEDGEFKVKENVFLLYPTFEHQNPIHLQFNYKMWLDEVCAKQKQLGDRKIMFDAYARVQDVMLLENVEKLKKLKTHFIFNDDYLDSRYEYKKDTLPLFCMSVRVYKIQKPVIAEEHLDYDGCRSWVYLKHTVAIEPSEPVLPDESFQKELKLFKDGLA